MAYLLLALTDIMTADEVVSEFSGLISKVDTSTNVFTNGSDVEEDVEFANSLLGRLLAGKSDQLSVSDLPADGTYATDTAKFNIRNTGSQLPEWDADACTQCGACSMACPQGAIRIKAYDDSYLENAPAGFPIGKINRNRLGNRFVELYGTGKSGSMHKL